MEYESSQQRNKSSQQRHECIKQRNEMKDYRPSAQPTPTWLPRHIFYRFCDKGYGIAKKYVEQLGTSVIRYY